MVFERWVEQRSSYGWHRPTSTLLPLDPPHQLPLELLQLKLLMSWMLTNDPSHSPLPDSPSSSWATATLVDAPAIVQPSAQDDPHSLMLKLLGLTYELQRHMIENI